MRQTESLCPPSLDDQIRCLRAERGDDGGWCAGGSGVGESYHFERWPRFCPHAQTSFGGETSGILGTLSNPFPWGKVLPTMACMGRLLISVVEVYKRVGKTVISVDVSNKT